MGKQTLAKLSSVHGGGLVKPAYQCLNYIQQ